jgi:hypothetical protein
MRLLCLPRQPAVAYLFLVRSHDAPACPQHPWLGTSGMHRFVSRSHTSAFDGRWVFHRSHTTPKGLHNEGLDTLVINPAGKCTETIDQIVTMLDQQGRAIARKIHIVQTRQSLNTRLSGDTLEIRWSALQIVAASSDKIPSGLHTQVGPTVATYAVRGDKLAATIGGSTDTFTRAK